MRNLTFYIGLLQIVASIASLLMCVWGYNTWQWFFTALIVLVTGCVSFCVVNVKDDTDFFDLLKGKEL